MNPTDSDFSWLAPRHLHLFVSQLPLTCFCASVYMNITLQC